MYIDSFISCQNLLKCLKYADFWCCLCYNGYMENTALTLDELNKMPKNTIALLYMQMSESFSILSAQSRKIQDQNERLIRQIEDLQEQAAILTQQRFGKRTETDKQVMGQLSFSLDNMCILNEAEALVENGIPEETDIEKVIV